MRSDPPEIMQFYYSESMEEIVFEDDQNVLEYKLGRSVHFIRVNATPISSSFYTRIVVFIL